MMRDEGLSLIYFTSDPRKGRQIVASGADAILLDCENTGKSDRQQGFNTEINFNNPEQIKEIRKLNPNTHIMCRVNNAADPTTEQQIKSAIKYGADTIVLPLIESIDQVKKIKSIINHKAKLIVMIETQLGLENFSSIAQEEFDAVYVGLNDLSISRGGRPLFEPLYDGTIETLVSNSEVPVGVGGVTDPSFGYPVKSAEIIEAFAKLNIKFTVLRRSFDQTIKEISPELAIRNIRKTYDKSTRRMMITEKGGVMNLRQLVP